MPDAPRYRLTPAEALRMDCLQLAAETLGCMAHDEIVSAAEDFHGFIKGKRRKAEVAKAITGENVIPWPEASGTKGKRP